VRSLVAGALGAPLAREALSRLNVAAVDWGKTRAFVLPSDHNGQIRVNLRGRERDGIVAPEEVDELCERIAAGLVTFRDPDGTRSVAAVERTSEIVGPDAPRLDLLPDLVVRWGDPPDGHLAGVASPRYGTVRRVGRGSGRSGAHTPDGWALVVPAAGRARDGGGPARLEDVAATACSLLGADAAGLAGEPLLDPA
jgi:predicted AlkP superfamily phosphohydrolase/phosphomutase